MPPRLRLALGMLFTFALLSQLAAADPAPPPPAVTETTEATTTTTTTDRKALRLAVYELKVDGIDERLGRVVTDAVVLELRKLQRVSVVSMDEVRAMLDVETQKQLSGCSEDSCLSEIADSLGVDGVVIGSLSAIGTEHIFGLRRIDQREGRALGQVTRRLVPEGGEEFLAAIGPAVEELFAEFELRPGAVRGVPPEVALRLNPPPLPPWVFWTTTATAAALTAATAAGLGINLVLQAQVIEKQGLALTTSVPGTELNTLRGQNDAAATATVVAGLAAGVVGLAAAGVSLFTDWTGAGAAQ